MEKQNDQVPDSGQAQIEDLTVNQDQAAEVKGGATQGRGQFCLSTDLIGPRIT